MPKAAVRTHGFLIAQYRVLARQLMLEPGQVDLATLPIFALANLAAGVTTVIPDADLRKPGSITAGAPIRQCARLGVTRSTASPAFFERVARQCEREGITLGLDRLDTGGAPVFPRLLYRLQAAAPAALVTAVYGSTEAEPVAEQTLSEISDADRAAMRSGAGLLAGPPVPDIEVRVLRAPWGTPAGPYSSEEFESACAAPSEIGGIVVTGPHVLKGYLNGIGDEETKFEVGGVRWHRTGDAGYLDDRGRLWLLGREIARIDDAKGELWPFAVETAASGFPGLSRSALVQWTGLRLLVVEPDRDGALDIDVLENRLAWAQLDGIYPVAHIPVDKRHNAKIDYPALALLLERNLG